MLSDCFHLIIIFLAFFLCLDFKKKIHWLMKLKKPHTTWLLFRCKTLRRERSLNSDLADTFVKVGGRKMENMFSFVYNLTCETFGMWACIHTLVLGPADELDLGEWALAPAGATREAVGVSATPWLQGTLWNGMQSLSHAVSVRREWDNVCKRALRNPRQG